MGQRTPRWRPRFLDPRCRYSATIREHGHRLQLARSGHWARTSQAEASALFREKAADIYRKNPTATGYRSDKGDKVASNMGIGSSDRIRYSNIMDIILDEAIKLLTGKFGHFVEILIPQCGCSSLSSPAA